jgi:hypothetical protein
MTEVSQCLPELQHDGPAHPPDGPAMVCGFAVHGTLTCLPWVGLLFEHGEA